MGIMMDQVHQTVTIPLSFSTRSETESPITYFLYDEEKADYFLIDIFTR
jgi:hypothetical protein